MLKIIHRTSEICFHIQTKRLWFREVKWLAPEMVKPELKFRLFFSPLNDAYKGRSWNTDLKFTGYPMIIDYCCQPKHFVRFPILLFKKKKPLNIYLFIWVISSSNMKLGLITLKSRVVWLFDWASQAPLPFF